MKHLRTVSYFCLLLLVGCPGKPIKPEKLNMGMIDCTTSEMITGVSGVGMTGREPICPKWDKATAFPPADYAKQNAYIKKLEKYVEELERQLSDHKAFIANACGT